MTSEQIRGQGVPFERIRRITGYLVGDMSRWNSGKKAEERDRVKHGVGGNYVKQIEILQSKEHTS